MTRQGGWPPTGFSQRLAELRQEAGLSQSELAERAGVHTMTISLLERGKQEPAWPLVRALCKALGVGCSAFEVEPPPEPPRRPRGRPRKGAED